MMTAHAKQFLVYCLVFAFIGGGVQLRANAALIETQQVAGDVVSEQKRDELKTLVSRTDVKRQLVAMGVDPARAVDRVDSLSDREVDNLYGQVGELPAGGDALGTIAIVLVILILLDLTGITDIFPRV
jgi:hypothetical protein